MEKKREGPRLVKIGDVEYEVDNFTEDQKAQLQGVVVADEELRRLRAQVALIETARLAYNAALVELLESKEADNTDHEVMKDTSSEE